MNGSAHKKHRSSRIAVMAAVMLTMVATLGVSPADATAPGENGRIAFRRYFNDEQSLSAIFTIQPDGTGLVQLTHRGKRLLDTEPDWSPDGRWIVFMRVKVGVYGRIYKMRSDGTHVTRLDPSCANDNCEELSPAWSPDGERIAFLRVDYDQGTESLSIMRADGTHVREMTDRWGVGSWSPDGEHMAVGRDTDKGTAVFTIALDGTHARRVTPWKLEAAVYDWSPDGRWILLLSHGDKDRQRNVYLVHPNGNGLHRVTNTFTHGESQWGGLTFSPDGTLIAASHSPGVGGVNPDVWVMNLDGSGLRDVTNSAIWDSAPDWGSRRA